MSGIDPRPAVAAPSGPPPDPGRPRTPALVWLALSGALLLLLAHAAAYRFLCDDAFISFRYARNLSAGHGLVFNPGHEPVEGYSNFLWVLLLAALHRLGLDPETASQALSFLATLALWGLVVWFARRTPAPRGREWLLLVPALFLAATRSVAVWSSSGLETRAFEALAVGGALRLAVEIEATLAGGRPRAIAAWLFALAAWTRPDGLLLSLAAFAVAGLVLARRGRLEPRRFLAGLLPFAILVGGQFAFRRLYYHEWLPNTYFAKVDGRTWWGPGLNYLATFALEYAVYLWLPLLAAALLHHLRRKTAHVPLLFAALVVPHALYVASIGGDHFEYRPLDLYFPFAFLLLYHGALELAGRRRFITGLAIYLAAVLLGLWELPQRSHEEFPDRYLPGFPGLTLQSRDVSTRAAARAFLAPDRDPIYALPGLRAIAEEHRRRLQRLTAGFVGIRQEEHRLFLASVEPEGRRLGELVRRGVLPPDVHFAIACVGAIPYYSDIRTLDRMGLTDAHVAHGPFFEQRFIAHDKRATRDYARQQGVDVWALEGVHPLCHVTSNSMLTLVRKAVTAGGPYYAADVGDGYYLLCELPQGLARASERMPRLTFRPMNDPALVNEFLERGIAAYRGLLERDPGDPRTRFDLAYLLLLHHEFVPALELYRGLEAVFQEDPELWVNEAIGLEWLGAPDAAIAALRRASALARASGDPERAAGLDLEQQRITRRAPGGIGPWRD